MKVTSTYPPGLGIGLALAALFLVLSLDLPHLIAVGYGATLAIGHVSRARFGR